MRPQYSDPNYPCASAYLEHYLESVEALPHDLQRNFTQLREIDAKIQDFVERLDQIGRSDLTALYSMDPTERAHRLADIQSLLETCLQYGNEKDRLAAQTYDMVEQHVRKLDMDAENYDNETKEIAKRPVERTNTNTSTANAGGGAAEGSVKRAKPAAEGNKEKSSAKPAAKKAKKDKVATATTTTTKQETKTARQPAKPANGEAHEENEHDEAKYCICEQVSYGEMVGCDNDQCPVEWFHFSCVGLTSKPKGKWYCPECRDHMSKSSRAR